MKVSTSRFGELEIEDGKVITILDGMIGFDESRFILLNPQNGGPFCWLQSTENPALAFVVVDPCRFVPNYLVKLTQDEHDKLQLSSGDETVLLSVVTMAPDPRLITANLQGPIIVNPARMLGMQIVMDGNYQTWYQLFSPEKSTISIDTKTLKPYKTADQPGSTQHTYNYSSIYSGMGTIAAFP